VFVLCIIASSDDSDDDGSDSNDRSQDAAATERPACVLSDQELNQLGAKILRAEMMGDEVRFIPCLILMFFSIYSF